jgi:hypothetical protein
MHLVICCGLFWLYALFILSVNKKGTAHHTPTTAMCADSSMEIEDPTSGFLENATSYIRFH